MHTKTITIHALDNCGSGLQAYALQQYLLSKGIDNEIIDYRPWYIHNNGRPLDWKFFVKRVVFGKGIRQRRTIYDNFIKNFLKVTPKKYTSLKALKDDELKADCFIAGSDQIWNSYFECGKDLAYYLDFVGNQKKVSYAASLGRTRFDRKKMDFMKKYVGKFDMVTVREKSAIKVMESIGIPAVQVCDPTLLLDAEAYRKNEVKLMDGNYILVYLTQASDLLDKAIERLRKKYKAQVVYVGSFLNRCKCDVNLRNVGPWEFVGLIDNAKYVIAGSFHASVFSCLLKKSFSVLPYENNIRMKELLNRLDLQDRFINSEDDLNIVDQEITPEKFDLIHKQIINWKKNSEVNFLKKIIEE
ncbi:MAG: polysaccharide pyruvyl transferase family protein [Ruminococcus sp.]|nr:polysaccharide pyruvyl transferase family protein [Ruminococcus sp.]